MSCAARSARASACATRPEATLPSARPADPRRQPAHHLAQVAGRCGPGLGDALGRRARAARPRSGPGAGSRRGWRSPPPPSRRGPRGRPCGRPRRSRGGSWSRGVTTPRTSSSDSVTFLPSRCCRWRSGPSAGRRGAARHPTASRRSCRHGVVREGSPDGSSGGTASSVCPDGRAVPASCADGGFRDGFPGRRCSGGPRASRRRHRHATRRGALRGSALARARVLLALRFLALPLHRRLLVVLTTASLGEDPALLDLLVEAAEGALERLVLTHSDFGQTRFTSSGRDLAPASRTRCPTAQGASRRAGRARTPSLPAGRRSVRGVPGGVKRRNPARMAHRRPARRVCGRVTGPGGVRGEARPGACPATRRDPRPGARPATRQAGLRARGGTNPPRLGSLVAGLAAGRNIRPAAAGRMARDGTVDPAGGAQAADRSSRGLQGARTDLGREPRARVRAGRAPRGIVRGRSGAIRRRRVRRIRAGAPADVVARNGWPLRLPPTPRSSTRSASGRCSA